MLCAQRFDVDGVGSQLSAVWLAAQAGHASTVAWLLQQGADGGAPGADGRTPLHVACAAGHHETVRNLLADKGVSLSARAEGGRTPAHCAAEVGQLECLRLVLHEGRRRGKPAVADAMMDLADGHRCVLPFLPASSAIFASPSGCAQRSRDAGRVVLRGGARRDGGGARCGAGLPDRLDRSAGRGAGLRVRPRTSALNGSANLSRVTHARVVTRQELP